MCPAGSMGAADAAAPIGADEELAEFQAHLNLLFARARTIWKESAARIHPDLQPSGYKLLTHIARAGATNAHQLAERFELDKSAVSRQLRMLEELELIESRPDEHDGRLRVLTATPKACAELADLRGGYADRIRGALAELTEQERRAAAKAFRILAEV